MEYISHYYGHDEFYLDSLLFHEQLGKDLIIVFASDGGAKPLRGLIWFIIDSTDTVDWIVTCWGQPVGIDPQSYCIEICSLLAAIYLLRLLMEYYDNWSESSKVITNTFKMHRYSKHVEETLENGWISFSTVEDGTTLRLWCTPSSTHQIEVESTETNYWLDSEPPRQ